MKSLASLPLADIAPAEWEIVKSLLEKYVPEYPVWAFGSRARWTAKPYSDLDLAVITPDPLSLQIRAALEEGFSESDLPWRVDVVDWSTTSAEFRAIISQDKVVVQSPRVGRPGAPPMWRRSTWGDEISLEYGKALRGYDTATGCFRVFGSNGPIGWTSQPLATGPGVILGRKGAYRRVQFSKEPFFVIDTAYYVVPKTNLNMRWLYYAVKHYALGEINDGSPIPSTTRSAVYVRELHVPSIAEQQEIAEILGALDDKIELNRKMSATLEAMARALFTSWFVDFDPVHAKAEGRETGLAPEIAALFSCNFYQSYLGSVPTNYHVHPLGDIARLEKSTIDPAKFPGEKFDHFSLPAYDNGRFPSRDLGSAIRSHKFLVPKEAILLSKLNPSIERVWLVDLAKTIRSLASTEFLPLCAKPPLTRSYLFCLARSEAFRGQQIALVSGTSNSHQRINVPAALLLPVVVPPHQILQVFDSLASPMLARVISAQRESRTLAALRDALLPKLISGELRVRAAERLVEGVL